MIDRSSNSYTGYSPPIKIEMLVQGHTFNVASVGGGRLILRDARPMAPATGIIRIIVDGQPTVHHVHLTDGIDPARTIQPYLLVGESSEAAA